MFLTWSCSVCSRFLLQVVTNPFTDEGGDMKQYHHPKCIFETFLRARPTTKIIQDPDDLENYSVLTDEDKDLVKTLIDGKKLCGGVACTVARRKM